uniref:(California timema) hypothetical protein n=1 Tax=Timema californicum TaxID=61474 RepID=A0A7R9J6U2_TIMCA|nr:unnamed protein product [Timema californicum]
MIRKEEWLPVYKVVGLDEGSTSESKFVSVKSEEHFNGKIETFTEELPIENIVIKCEECGKSFPEKGAMLKHTFTHYGQKPLKCDECGKCFKRKTQLLQHNLTHSGLKSFKCEECGKCFLRKTHLLQHNITHSGLKPFKCDEEKDYMRHTFTHSGLKRPSVMSVSFLRKNHILQHNLRHSGLKPFKCDDCGVTKEPFIDPLSLILV